MYKYNINNLHDLPFFTRDLKNEKLKTRERGQETLCLWKFVALNFEEGVCFCGSARSD